MISVTTTLRCDVCQQTDTLPVGEIAARSLATARGWVIGSPDEITEEWLARPGGVVDVCPTCAPRYRA